MLVATTEAAASWYQNATAGELAGGSKRVLIVPTLNIHTNYRDNTQARPEVQFTDSFLLATTNTFVRFEAARRYDPLPLSLDSTATAALPRASVLTSDTAAESELRTLVAHLADSADADLVALAIACSTGYKVYQPDGWRNNTGPAYARPTDATGFARVHLQVRARDGRLLYECIGKSSIGRPMLYGVFNGKRSTARRELAMKTDIVKAARKLYAPPIVRAIGRAARAAMPVR